MPRLLKFGLAFLVSVPFILILLKILEVDCEISNLSLMFGENVGRGLFRRIDDVSFWIIVSFALSCSLIIRTYFALSPANQGLSSSTPNRILFVVLAPLFGLTLCVYYLLCEVRYTNGTFYWEDRFEYNIVSDSTTCWEITKDSRLRDTTVYWVLFKDTTLVRSKIDGDISGIFQNPRTYGDYLCLPKGYSCFQRIELIQDLEGWLKLTTYLVTHLFCSFGFLLAQRIRRTQNVEAARLLITSTLMPFFVFSLIYYAFAVAIKPAIPEGVLSPTSPLKAMGRIVIYPIFFFLLHIWCRISWKDRLAISFRFSPLGFGLDVQKKP